MNPELRTISNNLELAKKYHDWDIVERAIYRLDVYIMEESVDVEAPKP